MPLLHFHIFEGRNEEAVKKLLDVSHEAMFEVFQVPYRDRYQLVSEYKPSHMIMEDTGLGIQRSENFILLQIFTRPRGSEAMTKFYRILADMLRIECGIEGSDLMISVVENNDSHWSFGNGRAQFLTGELGSKKTIENLF